MSEAFQLTLDRLRARISIIHLDEPSELSQVLVIQTFPQPTLAVDGSPGAMNLRRTLTCTVAKLSRKVRMLWALLKLKRLS